MTTTLTPAQEHRRQRREFGGRVVAFADSTSFGDRSDLGVEAGDLAYGILGLSLECGIDL